MRRLWWLGFLAGLVWRCLAGDVHAQGMEARFAPITAGTTNTAYTLSLPLKSLVLTNQGSVLVYVNVSGTGVAATTGETNIPVSPGESLVLTAGAGESVQRIGVITASGATEVWIRGTSGQ